MYQLKSVFSYDLLLLVVWCCAVLQNGVFGAGVHPRHHHTTRISSGTGTSFEEKVMTLKKQNAALDIDQSMNARMPMGLGSDSNDGCGISSRLRILIPRGGAGGGGSHIRQGQKYASNLGETVTTADKALETFSYDNVRQSFFGNNGAPGDDDGDSYTEIHDENGPTVASKVGNSMVGLIIGPILIVASCVFLWHNEKWAIKTHRSLNEALQAVSAIDASIDAISASIHNGKLIHVSDMVYTSKEGVTDPDFGLIRENSVSISRHVEIFQWVEKRQTSRRKMSNGTIRRTVTYHYHKQWTEKPISSAYFRKMGHDNHGLLPFQSKTFYANGVFLGSFRLSNEFVDQMNNSSVIPVSEVKTIPHGAETIGNTTIYFPVLGTDNQHASPQIGDVRIDFTEVKCAIISTVGKMNGNTVIPWTSRQGHGYDVALLEYGRHNAPNMIQYAQESNNIDTWFKRGGGLLVNFFGFNLLTSIISTTADISLQWIPLFGPLATGLVELGLQTANFIIASSLSLSIISTSWIFYRPVIGTPLLLLTCMYFFLASQLGHHVGSNHFK